MPDPDFEIRPKPGEEVCDFCSGTPVRWTYPARPHTSGTIVAMGANMPTTMVGVGSPDDWAACDRCHSLISRGARDELARYSVNCLRRAGTLPTGLMSKAEATRIIRGVQDNFWKSREGAPQPHKVD